MAERKAVNKYYPPDWDPRKGSANKRVGQHPLRDRAKKLSQGILVIRFELPYNIWCGGCGNHIGMGVRYNAEKSKVGNYYSTPIYKFRMKCHLCDNYFEIQTDPKNHDYVILSGARRKEQRWDPVANEQIVPEDKTVQKKLATDAMFKLEHGTDDQQKGSKKVMTLAQIEESRMSMLDDYVLNRLARDQFRAKKKQLKEIESADQAIRERASLDIDLVEESEEDRKLAGLMKFSVTSTFEEKRQEKRKSIEQRPIFSPGESSSHLPIKLSPSQTSSHPLAGGLSHKLSKILQHSLSDPFQIPTATRSVSHSVRPTTSRSRLGIRFARNRASSKKRADKLNLVKKQRQESFSRASYAVFSSSEAMETQDVIRFSPLLGNNNDVTQKMTEFLEQPCEDQGSQADEPLPQCRTEIVEDNMGHSNETVVVGHAGETSHSPPVLPLAAGSVDLHSSGLDLHSSGLDTLMCSYTDSDPDSET